MAAKALRFAALIRVSDKKQKERGESLNTQDTQTSTAVEQLDGIMATPYTGQEHATAGYERELLDKLLADAAKTPRPFDAVIVADPSRWSRDNVKSETGLEHLLKHGVRFFVLTTEYDLHEPDARLFLSLSTTFAGYQARVQKQKSMLNKLNRAKRGIWVAGGPPPYGRKVNEKTGMFETVPDEDKRALIVDAAKRVLAPGGSIKKVAAAIGMEHTRLHRILTKCSGDKWQTKFAGETVEYTIPRLLPEETIQAILKKVASNKDDAPPQWRYLIRGQINENGWFPRSTKYAENPEPPDCTRVNNIGSALSLPTIPFLGGCKT